MSFPLTKSHFLAGLQCPKRLWLAVCKPEYASPTSPKERRWAEANQKFRMTAQSPFPGVVIGGDLRSALDQTQTLLRAEQSCLFEAAFIFDDIFLRAHILRRRGSREWELLEGKPALKIEEEYLADLALQRYVLNGAGVEVARIGLILPALGAGATAGEFPGERRLTVTDVTQQVVNWEGRIPDYLAQFRQLLAQSEPPPVAMGPHCDYPRPCPFQVHCLGKQTYPAWRNPLRDF